MSQEHSFSLCLQQQLHNCYFVYIDIFCDNNNNNGFMNFARFVLKDCDDDDKSDRSCSLYASSGFLVSNI